MAATRAVGSRTRAERAGSDFLRRRSRRWWTWPVYPRLERWVSAAVYVCVERSRQYLCGRWGQAFNNTSVTANQCDHGYLHGLGGFIADPLILPDHTHMRWSNRP
jgi:hypothetical protein